MSTREEIEMETEYLDLIDANSAAKDAYRADPSPALKAAKEAAGQRLAEFRTQWREVRDAFAPPPGVGDGAARPAIHRAKGK